MDTKNEDFFCLICNKDLPQRKENVGSLGQIKKYDCSRCGLVLITDESEWQLKGLLSKKGHLISGALRWRTERGMKPSKPLMAADIEALVDSSEISRTVLEKADKLIEYVGDKSDMFGSSVYLYSQTHYPITFSPDSSEFKKILNHLMDEGVLLSTQEEGWSLSMSGWKKYYELKRIAVDSKQCFVAMNFDDAYDPIYAKIAEAIIACGFKPYRVKDVQNNHIITDLIIAEIKKSRFVIADFSGARPNVYFEAGFAKALGKEVIWTANKIEDMHFDTRQYSHIVWQNGDDLKRQLITRIEATIK